MNPSLIHSTRETILRTTLRACVILGGIAYVPGAWASVQGGIPEVLILTTAIYLALILVAFVPGLGFRARGVSLLAIILVLSVGLVVAIGPPGAGAIWLMSVPVMAGVLLGVRGAIWSLVGVAVTCVGLGILIHLNLAGPLPGAGHPGYPLAAWIATSGSLLFLSAILSIAVGLLLDRLEETASLEREGRLQLEASAREQLLLESRLRQSQKLEALGTLAGGIAHDFNNLLVPLIAGTEEARDGLPSDSPARGHLDDVLRSASRGRDLVRRILTFSRGGSEDRVPVRLVELLDEAERLLRHTFPASIRLERVIDAPEAEVLADPAELHQVVMNLGTNAYLAMEDTVGTLTLGLRSEGGEAILSVRDTGIGMDAETLARSMDPFFTTRGPDEGTGLGLSTVHGIVKGLGGRVSLSSEPGGGTTAEVRLPLLPTTATAPDPDPSPVESPVRPGDAPSDEPGRAKRRILLVDDDSSVRSVTARLLERMGFEIVSVAESERALLSLIRDEGPPFDLLLTDQTMPQLSGLELIRRSRAEGSEVPALLMSGFLSEAMIDEARALGTRVLAKPFVREELQRAVGLALEGAGTRRDVEKAPGTGLYEGDSPSNPPRS